MERDAAQASVKGDVAFFERFDHPEYTGVNPMGKLSTRSEEIDELKSGTFKADSIAVDELKVRIYGGDTAIVTGRNTAKGTYRGKDVSGRYRFTDTFVKESGDWRCVASQGTAITEP